MDKPRARVAIAWSGVIWQSREAYHERSCCGLAKMLRAPYPVLSAKSLAVLTSMPELVIYYENATFIVPNFLLSRRRIHASMQSQNVMKKRFVALSALAGHFSNVQWCDSHYNIHSKNQTMCLSGSKLINVLIAFL
jgi:hypothetical protein